MIVADTSVWVQYLRLPTSAGGVEMDSLLARDEVAMTGVVLAEVLQGARSHEDFSKLRGALVALPYLEASEGTWEKVGELAFQLRREGRVIPITDLAVAAVAMEHRCEVYTVDVHFQSIPGLELHGR